MFDAPNFSFLVKNGVSSTSLLAASSDNVAEAKTIAEKESALGSMQIQVIGLAGKADGSCEEHGCVNGECVNKVCKCSGDFVGERCDRDRAATISQTVKAYQTLNGALDGQYSATTLNQISSMVADLSGINGLADPTLVT